MQLCLCIIFRYIEINMIKGMYRDYSGYLDQGFKVF